MENIFSDNDIKNFGFFFFFKKQQNSGEKNKKNCIRLEAQK